MDQEEKVEGAEVAEVAESEAPVEAPAEEAQQTQEGV